MLIYTVDVPEIDRVLVEIHIVRQEFILNITSIYPGRTLFVQII